jgi:hypothetical protein
VDHDFDLDHSPLKPSDPDLLKRLFDAARPSGSGEDPGGPV